MINCTTCGNGIMKKSVATETFDKDNIIIVFRNVPAQVCDVCGDYIIEGSVAKSLLKKTKDERAKGHEINILNYKKAA